MKAPNRAIQGFSLIELMIAMLVGMFVMIGVMSIFGQTLRNNRDIIGGARLNQDLGTVATIMANDIRRAGYSGGGLPVYGGGDPAIWFNARNADLNIVLDASNNPSCILYSYNLDMDNPDSNDNGTVDSVDKTANDATGGAVIDTTERFGFKLNNGAIEMRRSCDPGSTAADPTNSCYTSCAANVGTWEAITDANVITVTELSFSTVGSRCLSDTTQSYWTIVEPGTPTVFTDDPYSFPCDNNSALYSGARLTEFAEVSYMVLGGTPPTYSAGTSTNWAADVLRIPPSLTWATTSGNAQVLATPTTWWNSAVETRQINIHIRAQLVADPTVIKETTTQIKVGNNRVFVAPNPT